MSSHAPDLLSSIFTTERLPGPVVRGAGLALKIRDASAEPFEVIRPQPKRRTQIWEMHPSVHCSIVGTCLSSGELRRLLVKLRVHGSDSADEHAVHKRAVALAGRQHDGAKFIQKALDHRHEAAIKQCTKIRDEAGLLAAWEDALKSGDIPGAYWAVLSHPAATEAIMRRAFGDVHMLSHMVGAANRADIRRLRQLEEDNAALGAKLELQQRQLRDGFTARDTKIRMLNEALSRALAQAPLSAEHTADDAAAARDALVDLDRRLNREVARSERLESRMEAAKRASEDAERRHRETERENEALRRELAFAEARLSALLTDSADEDSGAESAEASPLEVAGALVLYVGGRAHQVPRLKAAVESAGGVFLYHDGGIEHSAALLPGLVSRADCAAFPIDCVSHDAMANVKRLCRQAAKPFIPLRTSSLTSLMSGLATLRRQPAPVTGA